LHQLKHLVAVVVEVMLVVVVIQQPFQLVLAVAEELVEPPVNLVD
jgi:hypothetical protein